MFTNELRVATEDQTDATDWHGKRQSIDAPCCGETSTHHLGQEVGQKEVATDLPLNDSTAHREKQVQLVQPHQHDLVELKAIVRWTEESNPQTMEPKVSLHLWQLHEM